jgi:hypothetical protein
VAPVARRRPVARIPSASPSTAPPLGQLGVTGSTGGEPLAGCADPLRSGRLSVNGDTCGEAPPASPCSPSGRLSVTGGEAPCSYTGGRGRRVLPGPHRAHGSDGRSHARQSRTRELTASVQGPVRFSERPCKSIVERAFDTCQVIAYTILSSSIISPMLCRPSATQRRKPPRDCPRLRRFAPISTTVSAVHVTDMALGDIGFDGLSRLLRRLTIGPRYS